MQHMVSEENFYIGKFEEELLTHIMLLYTDKHCQGHGIVIFSARFFNKINTISGHSSPQSFGKM